MIPWVTAWQHALYGPSGFYRRPEGPAGHFRTAAHAAPAELAAAVLDLALGLGCTAIVDVGAGRGELLSACAALASGGFRLHGVDVVARPGRLPARVSWSPGLGAVPVSAFAGALVIGWELLDVVPHPILELDDEGELRTVLVAPATGRESLGPTADLADREWCTQWWPRAGFEAGDRVEPGGARDRFWAGLVQQARAGGAHALLAVDYGHERETRPGAGSLSGFQRGRPVPPRPDGSMDITSHVAIDAVAAAGTAAGAATVQFTTQAAALAELGVRSAELVDPGGLGSFHWLLQSFR